MVLARPPRAPKEHTWITVAVSRVPDEWLPFLAAAS
jgi:hypothetical protein